MDSDTDTTILLGRWTDGDPAAGEELFDRLYDDLRAVASNRLRADPGSTLQTTALVHEAYLRFAGQSRASFHSRGHFFAIAASVMRRILVDHARRRTAGKRGGRRTPISLHELSDVSFGDRPDEVLALDEVLHELAALAPDQVRLVELRFFAGLTVEETAEALQTSRATVIRQWRVTKGWLHRRLAA